jgi:hypothetical protein
MLVDQVHNLHDMSVQTLLKAVAEIGYDFSSQGTVYRSNKALH